MAEVILTEEQLQERLKYWQEKLRLQDWEIEVKIKKSWDMPENTVACVDWTLNRKIATIFVLDPDFYSPYCAGERDMEQDLVHELLHLHLAPIHDHFGNNDKIFSTFEEQAIESIASALIALDRKDARKDAK